MTDQLASTHWHVHSDGSCLGNPGPAGWAFKATRPNGSSFMWYGNSPVGATRTNNAAEMYALWRAILAVPEDQTGTVYSDSEYAINAATIRRARWEKNGLNTASGDPVKNPGLVKKLWAALDARPGVILEHVKGHSGIEGNEEVDKRARWAAEEAKAGRHIDEERDPPLGSAETASV